MESILNGLMPGSTIPETPVIDITGDNSMNEGKDEIPKNHECQGVDDPKRGGKTNNRTIKKLDAESKDATIKVESGGAFIMPHSNKELLNGVWKTNLSHQMLSVENEILKKLAALVTKPRLAMAMQKIVEKNCQKT